MFCAEGDKPTITYKFSDGNQKIYKSNYSPIDIIAQEMPAEANENYNHEGYGLSVNAVNGNVSNLAVVAHEIIRLPPVPDSPFPSGGLFLRYMRCGETTWRMRDPCTTNLDIAAGCAVFDYNLNPGSYSINPDIKCSNPSQERCSIIVKHKGLIVFQDQGECPITYEVSCGNCPEGQEEHKISTYPGYCCFDCAGMKSEIITLKNAVRTINNG